MSSPPELRFAPLAAADEGALAALFARNRGAAGGFEPFPLSARSARAIATARGRDGYYLTRDGAAAVALSMLRGFDEGYEVPSLGLLVDRSRRRRGIGRFASERTIEAARERGCAAVRLSVYASNAAALALYRSLGFEERERAPRGAGDERIVMVLELGSPR